MKHTFLLLLILIFVTSCIFITNDLTPSDIKGCYITSMPDPHSPEDNPPLVDFYIQLWEDGTGEGGFWDDPLTESNFFTWELANDTLIIAGGFNLFDNCTYYIETNDSSSFLLKAQQGETPIATFHLSNEIVSRVDFNKDFIVGTWNNSRANSYTFSADSLFRDGFRTTSWDKSDIPHVIELGGGYWAAVRVMNADTVIMAGYNNILIKQP